MAKKQKGSVRTSLEEFNESLSSIEQKIEGNKKLIYWPLAIILVIMLVAVAYIYGFRNPNLKHATEDISKADMELLFNGNDSLALQSYQNVANKYSNKPANRANLNAAILLYQKGKYEEAAKYLNNFDPKGNIVGPASQSLLGDCYVNLKQLDKAVAAFDKAISLSGDNADYTPLFILKKAVVLHEQKQYSQEAALYQGLKDKYPAYAAQHGIDKYIERAKALAGE
ncbi:MAG: tetratricopeptide repeat protein [Muribaculaceae bacterium]|nr:tetratricopeptide repeat protein [Muribaculaceae bacterium]